MSAGLWQGSVSGKGYRDGGMAGGVWQETRVFSRSLCHAWPLG